jgi:GntR family transcriptional regulator
MAMDINRNSPLPLYYQLKELLLENIQQGYWKPGQQLPTEEDIQRKYDLSRTTVRLALKELELDGKINRRPGKGTFVTFPKVQEGSESFNLDVLEFQEHGLQLSWKVLSNDQFAAPSEIAARLQIKSESKIFGMRRLRMANNILIGFTVSYVSGDFLDKIDHSLTEAGGSMNYLTGIDLSRCTVDRVVEALPAGREDAKVLEMTPGDPVLVITRILKNADGRPIELFRGIYRGDRFQYRVQTLPPQV